jgi:hypothetical protein
MEMMPNYWPFPDSFWIVARCPNRNIGERPVNRILPGGVGWRVSFPRTWEFYDGKNDAVGEQGRVLAGVGPGAAAMWVERSGVLSAGSGLGAVVLCLAKEIAHA